jgi:hypothetical protein
MWDGLSSPSSPTFPPPPGQPGKAVLRPPPEIAWKGWPATPTWISLQWPAYKHGALEHSCGTGFPARPRRPPCPLPWTAWKGCPTPHSGQPGKAVLQPAQDRLERLSYDPHPAQPGKAGLQIRLYSPFPEGRPGSGFHSALWSAPHGEVGAVGVWWWAKLERASGSTSAREGRSGALEHGGLGWWRPT